MIVKSHYYNFSDGNSCDTDHCFGKANNIYLYELHFWDYFTSKMLLLGYATWHYHSWVKPDMPQIYHMLSLLHISVDTISPWLHQMTHKQLYSQYIWWSCCIPSIIKWQWFHFICISNFISFIGYSYVNHSDFSFISYHFALPCY